MFKIPINCDINISVLLSGMETWFIIKQPTRHFLKEQIKQRNYNESPAGYFGYLQTNLKYFSLHLIVERIWGLTELKTIGKLLHDTNIRT